MNAQVKEWADKYGFTSYHTGGGCMALHKSENGIEVFIANDDSDIPSSTNEDCYVGVERDDGPLFQFELKGGVENMTELNFI